MDNLLASQTKAVSALNPIKIRKKLLHGDIRAEGLEQVAEYPLATLTEYIAVRSRREFPVHQYAIYQDIFEAAWKDAWLRMLCCGPHDGI